MCLWRHTKETLGTHTTMAQDAGMAYIGLGWLALTCRDLGVEMDS